MAAGLQPLACQQSFRGLCSTSATEQPPLRPLQQASRLPMHACRWGGTAGPQLRGRRRAALERVRPQDSAAGSLGSLDQPDRDPRDVDPWKPASPTGPVQQYPRRRERNPYKRLGLPDDASFDEVIDAKIFLAEQYQSHDPSREAIELAYEAILGQDMKARQKYGFRPPTTGRKTDLAGDELRKSPVQLVKERLEPSVPASTIVNDGSIFVVLGAWAGVMLAKYDPTLPLGAALCFCAWRLFAKRRARSPEGPYWGNSPVWGALATTLAGLLLGGLVSWAMVQGLPLPDAVPPEAFGIFIIVLALGATCIWVK